MASLSVTASSRTPSPTLPSEETYLEWDPSLRLPDQDFFASEVSETFFKLSPEHFSQKGIHTAVVVERGVERGWMESAYEKLKSLNITMYPWAGREEYIDDFEDLITCLELVKGKGNLLVLAPFETGSFFIACCWAQDAADLDDALQRGKELKLTDVYLASLERFWNHLQTRIDRLAEISVSDQDMQQHDVEVPPVLFSPEPPRGPHLAEEEPPPPTTASPRLPPKPSSASPSLAVEPEELSQKRDESFQDVEIPAEEEPVQKEVEISAEAPLPTEKTYLKGPVAKQPGWFARCFAGCCPQKKGRAGYKELPGEDS